MKMMSAFAAGMFVAGLSVGGNLVNATTQPASRQNETMAKQPSTLGAFSISLSVKNLGVSRAFYEKLGFHVVDGDAERWLILRNGAVNIGLFQGLFDRNALTFNPGWDHNGQPVAPFTDVREHQRRLKSLGLSLTSEADQNGSGPASFTLLDPDGNPILIDQHVPKATDPATPVATTQGITARRSPAGQ